LTRQYDLASDLTETRNVADRPENREVVEELLSVLADHLRRTDRDPGTVPNPAHLEAVLKHCLTPVESKHHDLG
jgi:hypothetical protein